MNIVVLNSIADIIKTLIEVAIALIPTAIAVAKYFKEKNWSKLVGMAGDLMKEAESKLENGADRKQWVIAMLKVAAEDANCNVDDEAISKLIDGIVDVSKVVNVSSTAEVKAVEENG